MVELYVNSGRHLRGCRWVPGFWLYLSCLRELSTTTTTTDRKRVGAKSNVNENQAAENSFRRWSSCQCTFGGGACASEFVGGKFENYMTRER